MKFHHIINEHPTWFSAEQLLFQPDFLRNFCTDIHNWALEEIEKERWEEVEKLQLRRLRKLVHHAYFSVPLWNRVFSEANLHPKDIRSLGDLKKIPCLSNREFRATPLRERVCLSKKVSRYYQKMTSGSTGVPMVSLLDKYLSERYAAISDRGVRWVCGSLSKDDFTIRIVSRSRTAPQYNLVLGLQEFNNVRNIKERLWGICKRRVCIVFASPSTMLQLASLEKLDDEKLRFKGILLTEEDVHPSVIKFISEVFQCSVSARYACSESSVIASMCTFGNYHTNPDQYCLEIDTDRTIGSSKNKVGKILLTDFNSYTMPLIRYEVGDIGTLLPSTYCGCGSLFPVLEFLGRDRGTITLPNRQTRFITEIISPLSHPRKRPWILQFQIVRRSHRDFDISLVTTNRETQADMHTLGKAMQKKLGDGTNVQIKRVPEIKVKDGQKLHSYVSMIE